MLNGVLQNKRKVNIMFKKFEFEYVGEYPCTDGTTECRRIQCEEDKEEAILLFWTVYGRKEDNTVRALIDTNSEEDAKQLTEYFNSLLSMQKFIDTESILGKGNNNEKHA